MKSGESKYEINTNLPLARARRLKSDMHDFSLSFLPFVGSSWGTGRGRTLNLPPHLLFLLLSFRCGGSLFWLGFWCTPECLPFTVLLDHEAMLFLLIEPEKHILPSDTETDFSLSDIDPCLGRPSKRSPSISITTKSARTKESRTRTKTCSVIPSSYRMVESASCTSIVVGERAGYSSALYITLGIIFTLAPQIA